jgi:pyridoxal phosphate enzyme (YggS family)
MTVAARLAEVRDRIAAAASRSGRATSDVTLVAVSKTFPADVVSGAIRCGVADVGENRVQEAAAKRPAVSGAARWHLIGPLQRNKAGPALETFDVVHTLDRPRLAERLDGLLERDWPERRLPVLLEVNVGDEPQKAGALPEDVRQLLETSLGLERLEVVGLMAIPPFEDDPEASRPYFGRLRELRDRLEATVGHPLPELSMGMSHDFEIAIEEGATLVRVGSAIFGPRSG